MSNRPASELSCASLARELDVSETTVHEMVRRGVLPAPVGKLSAGCVRWCWAEVQLALGSLSADKVPDARNRSVPDGGAQCHVSGIDQLSRFPRACIASSQEGASISIIRPVEAPTMYGDRIKLPNDPHSPEFWQAVRQAQGIVGPVADGHDRCADRCLRDGMAGSASEAQPRHQGTIRALACVWCAQAWGDLHAASLRPPMCRPLSRRLAQRRPDGQQRARRSPRHVPLGLRPARAADPRPDAAALLTSKAGRGTSRGHRSNSPAPTRTLPACCGGPMSSARYTGQRISDIVRLGWTDIDEGGFACARRKPACSRGARSSPNSRPKWRHGRSGPGRSSCRIPDAPSRLTCLWKKFDDARKDHPGLADAVWHGLRANAVIRLRQADYSLRRSAT